MLSVWILMNEETDLLTMEIETGEATPKKQASRRMPFAVRSEVAQQLRDMQAAGVVKPSNSPWASPVVMVCKRDGTHRFCVDYRELNSVTKDDTFPLHRIDDLLDQLGEARYFSTLDLASGYWQIRMHPDSVEKTAFITPQGLFQFQVMPFGLTNAPSVFQRLMERVLAGLNPEDGPDFVSVYINNVLVFSCTLEEHLQHLRQVIQRISAAGLKLMERVLAGLNPEDGPDFVSVYINNVLVFSCTLEEHLQHLRQVIQRISAAGLKLKPSKCHFI